MIGAGSGGRMKSITIAYVPVRGATHLTLPSLRDRSLPLPLEGRREAPHPDFL